MSHNGDQDARWTRSYRNNGRDDFEWRDIREEFDNHLRVYERKIDLLLSGFIEFKSKQIETQEEREREQSELNFEIQKQLLRLQDNSSDLRARSVTEAELKALHDRLQHQEGMIIALIDEVKNMKKSRMAHLWKSKLPPDISNSYYTSATAEASLLKGGTQQALWTQLLLEGGGGFTSQEEEPDKDAQAESSGRVGFAAPRVEYSRSDPHRQEVLLRPRDGNIQNSQPSGPLTSKQADPSPKYDPDRHQTHPSGVVGPADSSSREIATRAQMDSLNSAELPGYQKVVKTSALFGSSHLSDFSRAHSYQCKYGYSTVALVHCSKCPQKKQGLFIHFVDEEDHRALRNPDCAKSRDSNDEECSMAGNQMTFLMFKHIRESSYTGYIPFLSKERNYAQVDFVEQYEDPKSGRGLTCTLDLYFIASDASGLWNRLVKIPIKFNVVVTVDYEPFAGGSHMQIMRPKKMYPGRLPESALRYSIEECDGKQWLNLNHYEPGARVLLQREPAARDQ